MAAAGAILGAGLGIANTGLGIGIAAGGAGQLDIDDAPKVPFGNDPEKDASASRQAAISLARANYGPSSAAIIKGFTKGPPPATARSVTTARAPKTIVT